MSSTVLEFNKLLEIVSSNYPAFRLKTKLEAVSPKIFPPTYGEGAYATEERMINGQTVPCVMLDSVASQANRMEQALQNAWESDEIELPIVSVDFRSINHPGIRKITSLQAPHRIADAILRDSTMKVGDKQIAFRKSPVGIELDQLNSGYASPLLKHAPHALVFGMWDSTGPRGGLGVKFARAIVSEIIGINSIKGRKTKSRIDPLNVRASSGILYKTADGWTLDEKLALKEKGKPILIGKKKEGKPSDANHSNIPPEIEDGGFTIDYAEQTTVLSLPALRRLRFPAELDGKSNADANNIARAYLATLGLLGATLAVDDGYDLRSRCILRATEAIQWTLLGQPGEADIAFSLTRQEAIQLYRDAVAAVRKAQLPFHTEEIVLTPSEDLLTLVKKSIELAAIEGGEAE